MNCAFVLVFVPFDLHIKQKTKIKFDRKLIFKNQINYLNL